ncbi:MAG: tetratricopeptide repeat protein, partial [Fibrobacterota bacterium]
YAYEENDFIRGIEILTPLYEYVKDRENTSLILYYGKLISLFMNVEELYDESIPLLNELCEYDSSDYTVHLYRGISHTYSGDIDSAQKAFERAIQLSEDDYSRIFTVYRYAIIGSVDMDTVSVAQGYMKEFKDSSPDSAATYYLLGKASNRMDEYAQALDYLDTAQSLMEEVTWEMQFQKAIAYDNLNNFEQAEELLQDIIASDSANHLASNYLGYSWVDRGVNLSQAKELIENALKQRPNSAAYLDSYAWVHYRLGKPEDALKYINKALEQSQSDYLLFYHKADILKRLEKYETAEQYYKKALSFSEKISDRDREMIQRHLEELQGYN